jgi:hypothetical protein
MSILHPGHYLDLLAQEPAYPVAIDAIIVPASRGPGHLAPAATLAANTLTPLVVFGSKDASGDGIAAELAEHPGLQWAAVDVPEGYEHPLLQTSAQHLIPKAARPDPPSDLSLKRNLGLLVGRQFGDKIFFMDDDIQLYSAQLEHVGRLLAKYAIAGLRSTNFADKSVIGRMEQEWRPPKVAPNLGQPHRADVFISGNALGVHLGRVQDHFPDIYNEDWLFMFSSLLRGKVIAAGESYQAPYDPYILGRATREEFGETIADGLYDACLNGQTSMLKKPIYWDHVLEHRRERISGLRDGRRQRADLILREALAISRLITPELCTEYIGAWRRDHVARKSRLAAMPTHPSFEAQLRSLDLTIHAKSAEFAA